MTLSDTWVDFVAGWCSGAAAVVLLQPLDTILTRQQAGLAFTKRNLWRGASPMVTAVPLQNALLMGGYGIGQQYGTEQNKYLPIFVGGCSGGVLQSFLMSPVELVKVAQQCPDSTASLRHIKALNVARGLGATLLRDGIPHGVWFAAYEASKDVLEPHWKDPVGVPLLSGAVAASVAWGVGYPADIIKTRIQTGTGTEGIIGTLQLLIQENEGRVFRALYKGFTLKLIRAVPASMIGFTVYEAVKNQLT